MPVLSPLHHIYTRTPLMPLISPALFLWHIIISGAFFILINYRMLGVISLELLARKWCGVGALKSFLNWLCITFCSHPDYLAAPVLKEIKPGRKFKCWICSHSPRSPASTLPGIATVWGGDWSGPWICCVHHCRHGCFSRWFLAS